MPILGAHQSIAGGYHKAVEIGVETGCQVIQIFTKNTNQWRGKPITPEEARRFREAVAASGIACPLAHDSYLINLASPEETLWKKSIDALIDEVQRAAILGIPWVVSHPGAYTTTSEEEGLKRIVAALDEVLGQTSDASAGILLETTAGQGTTLGWRFEQLGGDPRRRERQRPTGRLLRYLPRLRRRVQVLRRGGLSGHDEAVRQVRRARSDPRFPPQRQREGLRQPCRSARPHRPRNDRSRGISAGCLRDRRFRNVPMVMETPKGKENGEDLDVINLRMLRELAAEKIK